ncbi:acyltransferase family protein [Cystobacter fuscus]|uniref:acyltransferase family protein n=1 Tax=Cystobacter fuscus TaxID=43 RepID=UPI002B29EABF|nr:acyltransferase family protein [Cystobacter fuscus]
MNPIPRPATERRPDLDWLRVVAILLLHLFHTGMMFNSWDWHLKAPELLPVLEPSMEFLHHVRMPLLMLISGAVTAMALRRRGLGAFVWDRTKRLLWPLVFGIFVIVPPQIYAERLFRGTFHGGYLDFYPSVFQFVSYPAGSFSWHHLWFVAYLFIYCLLAAPLFAWLETARGRAFFERAEAWLARGWNPWLLFLPLALGRILLRRFPETHALTDDPNTFVYYGQLFLLGHILGRGSRLQERLVVMRHRSLAISGVLFALMVPSFEYPFPFEHLGTYALVWCLLLTALGYARAHIPTRSAWVTYAQELAYPFYIFHQTVIVLVGFALLRPAVGPWTRFGLVLTLSFLVTWALCECVKRVPWLRPCFGMAGRKPVAPGAVPTPSPLEARSGA